MFGSASPRVQVPNLLHLYETGQLKIDEIITQEYALDQVQQGYDDQAAGTIIRGVVRFERDGDGGPTRIDTGRGGG